MKKIIFSLADVFKPVCNSRKIAFTLAEVLITLGIIGVVAALTLPTLIQNHRKQVVETRLKHFYSIVNQAVTLSEAVNGDKKGWDIGQPDQFWNYIEPYLKYNKVEIMSAANDPFRRSVYLSNGSGFIISYSEMYFYPEAKNINKINQQQGKDFFRFAFYPNRNSNNFIYHRNKGVEPYLVHWRGNENSLYTTEAYGCYADSATNNTGAWCTALIQRNGWEIPKDYPFKF